MGINHRQFVKATRVGTRRHLKQTSYVPMLLKREMRERKKNSHKRFIYCERLDIHTVDRMDKRAYQRYSRIRKRMERGFRMVRKVYGKPKDNFLGR